MRIYTDHRNLAYISNPRRAFDWCQRLRRSDPRTGRWCLRSTITQPCIFLLSANIGGDLLSLCVNVPAVAVRAVVVFASSTLDETMPSKNAIRQVQ